MAISQSGEETLILIDLSYFIFYRYFALLQWWKMAKEEEELGDPSENEDFIEKFKKTFREKILEIPKKLKLKKFKILGAKDCPRKDIWRNEIYKDYKGTRVYDDKFMGGYFFKLSYEEIIPEICQIIESDNLEADDCIALTCKIVLNDSLDKNIIIIANDMDYLQLADENIKIINLKYKNLQESKNSNKDKDKDLFCKIVLGDKSDNIPGIFKKCGAKTALKYYEDRELFEKMIKKENVMEVFLRNKKIIDFNEIPLSLQENFNIHYKKNINI